MNSHDRVARIVAEADQRIADARMKGHEAGVRFCELLASLTPISQDDGVLLQVALDIFKHQCNNDLVERLERYKFDTRGYHDDNA